MGHPLFLPEIILKLFVVNLDTDVRIPLEKPFFVLERSLGMSWNPEDDDAWNWS
jgi:hypothetical protein